MQRIQNIIRNIVVIFYFQYQCVRRKRLDNRHFRIENIGGINARFQILIEGDPDFPFFAREDLPLIIYHDRGSQLSRPDMPKHLLRHFFFRMQKEINVVIFDDVVELFF